METIIIIVSIKVIAIVLNNSAAFLTKNTAYYYILNMRY